MARFWKKTSRDWCHVCGTRGEEQVGIDYPRNAEHQALGETDQTSGGGESKYLRICADCGETIARIGRGEMRSEVRNNRALVTAHIKGISPYFKPLIN